MVTQCHCSKYIYNFFYFTMWCFTVCTVSHHFTSWTIDYCQPVADMVSRQRLRSLNRHLLHVTWYSGSICILLLFSGSGILCRLNCDSLSDSLKQFKQHFKTHFFRLWNQGALWLSLGSVVSEILLLTYLLNYLLRAERCGPPDIRANVVWLL